jgi:hypothetical protein
MDILKLMCPLGERMINGFGPEHKFTEEDPVARLDHLRHLLGAGEFLVILFSCEFLHGSHPFSLLRLPISAISLQQNLSIRSGSALNHTKITPAEINLISTGFLM